MTNLLRNEMMEIYGYPDQINNEYIKWIKVKKDKGKDMMDIISSEYSGAVSKTKFVIESKTQNWTYTKKNLFAMFMSNKNWANLMKDKFILSILTEKFLKDSINKFNKKIKNN